MSATKASLVFNKRSIEMINNQNMAGNKKHCRCTAAEQAAALQPNKPLFDKWKYKQKII